jgi:tRNA-dihydrouridine synthase B
MAAGPRIEMAPMQGLAGHLFRAVYLSIFEGVDHSYCPFVRLRGGQFSTRDHKELEAGLSVGDSFTPQIIAASPSEVRALCERLAEYGHRRVNLNLGCPAPMETKRKKGAGLLPFPDEVEKMLETLCRFEPTLEVSVKTRLGLRLKGEFSALVPVFNRFPLSALIVHPRTAKQMYSGAVAWEYFGQQARLLTMPVIANGDMRTLYDALNVLEAFPWIAGLMIGRGLLRDPFLPATIKELELPSQRADTLRHFHDKLLEAYERSGMSPGHILDKMRELWKHLAYSFEDAPKVARRFKKVRSIEGLQDLANSLSLSPPTSRPTE